MIESTGTLIFDKVLLENTKTDPFIKPKNSLFIKSKFIKGIACEYLEWV